ncbi:hypothetical protein [uncultured Parasutterella sp.]|uniref:hypothetical protein n=1 Tax=uncultured Parasutterella sp. TaxID=1263098 RepID=UPI00351C6638
MIKSVKESSQIKVYDPHISVLHMFHGLPNCVAAVPIGSKPVAHICTYSSLNTRGTVCGTSLSLTVGISRGRFSPLSLGM